MFAKSHRKYLAKRLRADGWEQVFIHENCDEWYIYELWQIRSMRERFGMELNISFLVDPQFEGIGQDKSGVWEIMASEGRPTYFNKAPGEVAVLVVSSDDPRPRIDQFVAKLHEYRSATS